MAKSVLDIIALVLVIIGALNWGLVAVGVGDVVALLLGVGVVANIVYGLVGLAGLYTIYLAVKK